MACAKLTNRFCHCCYYFFNCPADLKPENVLLKICPERPTQVIAKISVSKDLGGLVTNRRLLCLQARL